MIDTSMVMNHMLGAGRFDPSQTGAVTPHQVNHAAVTSGQIMGFKMEVISNPAQDLQDSMEELSMQFEEKTVKKMGDRKIGEGRSPYIRAVNAWQKVLPDMPGGQFMERMLRQLRMMDMQGRQPTAKELLSMLEEGSGDASHMMAMLDILSKALGKDEKSLAKLFLGAQKELEETRGEEARAGLNLAEAVNAEAETPEDMQALRDLYRGEVLGFKDPRTCFRSLGTSQGMEGMKKALDFLIRGCGVELNSPSPSQSEAKLRSIMLDLQAVNVLTTMMEDAGKLAGKMGPLFGEPCPLDGMQLTDRILSLVEKAFVGPEEMAKLLADCGARQLLARIYLCTGMIGLFHTLSERLFDDPEGRFKLIDAAQEHLDGLVTDQEAADEEERKKGETAA